MHAVPAYQAPAPFSLLIHKLMFFLSSAWVGMTPTIIAWSTRGSARVPITVVNLLLCAFWYLGIVGGVIWAIPTWIAWLLLFRFAIYGDANRVASRETQNQARSS